MEAIPLGVAYGALIHAFVLASSQTRCQANLHRELIPVRKTFEERFQDCEKVSLGFECFLIEVSELTYAVRLPELVLNRAVRRSRGKC
jgi:hypothetical protein